MVVSISTIPFGAPLNNAPTTKRCLKVGSDALRSTRRFSKLDVEKCHVLLTDLKLESYPPLPLRVLEIVGRAALAIWLEGDQPGVAHQLQTLRGEGRRRQAGIGRGW